ncbi:MAG: Gfo/Idh/MocA family oxidoreductase [Bryobacteraceae bacterium]|nr:Gfo/Idh/MocA family oxidoreductase [Bryobacteraceae bacterium]
MRVPASTIWDTRIQAVCSVVCCRDGEDVEFWMCANFGQAGLDPPKLIINPNRVYPLEGAVRREKRFSVSVFREDQHELARKFIEMRRRGPDKATALGVEVRMDGRHGIPFVPGCSLTIFCELDEVLDTGDHTVMTGRVLESRKHSPGQLPLLYPEVAGGRPDVATRLTQAVSRLLSTLGLQERLRQFLVRRRGGAEKPDLPALTYHDGGFTDAEIDAQEPYGFVDRSRILKPPATPAILKRKMRVCVAGTGSWGSYHCRLFREASPEVELWVCGRTEDRTASFARRVGATGYVVGLERAAEDRRFEAMSLVLPHHIHRMAVEAAASGGKHILLEKPVANTLEDADAIIDAARRAGVLLMVAENMHFRPDVSAVARDMARGDAGEPLYWNAIAGGVYRPSGWKAKAEQMGGGVLLDIGVHYLRTLRLLMGEPDRVLATRAMQIHTSMEGEDSAQVLFSSRYGWQGHMLASWSTPRGDSPDIVVAGDRGTFHLWGNRPFYDFYPARPTAAVRLVSMIRPASLAQRLMRPELGRERRRIEGKDGTGYVTEIREFLAAVAENRAPSATAEDGRRDLEIALCMARSLRTEAWVECGVTRAAHKSPPSI